ncbi:MAG: hypothetical protein ABMA64_27080, partial [Myxococcota bacterium]
GPYHEGMYALTEAAIAWRAGDRATAGWLAGRARDAFRAVGLAAHLLLAEGLAAVTAGASAGQLAELGQRASACPEPEIALQVFGLLARAQPRRAATWAERARAVPVTRDPARHGVRLDVLSIHECLEPTR